MHRIMHLSTKPRIFRTFAGCFVLLACLGFCSSIAFSSGKRPLKRAKVGLPAPDFTLKDEKGNSHTLTDYRGSVVVLEWTDPDCPTVEDYYARQNGIDQTAMHTVSNAPVKWFAVNSNYFNTPKMSETWCLRQAMVVRTLLDTSGKIAKRYQVKKTPTIFVIDARGVLRYRGAIDDNPEGNKKQPVEYVRRVLEALINGDKIPFKETEAVGCPVRFKP